MVTFSCYMRQNASFSLKIVSKYLVFRCKCVRIKFLFQNSSKCQLFKPKCLRMASFSPQNTEMAEYRIPRRSRMSRHHRSKALDAPDSNFDVPRSNFEFFFYHFLQPRVASAGVAKGNQLPARARLKVEK